MTTGMIKTSCDTTYTTIEKGVPLRADMAAFQTRAQDPD